jgi:hypothetical protein
MTRAVSNTRRASLVLAALLCLALAALQVEYRRHAGPLWRDEVNSVNLATLPSFGEVLRNAHLDSFPVVWASLLHAWTAAGLGDTDRDLRRLGLLVGLATLIALWWTARQLDVDPPLIAFLLFGMSPTIVIYGDMVRGYGLAALATIACIGAMWRWLERPTPGRWLVAQAAALLAVQTHYANCLLLLAIGVGAAAVCIWRRRWTMLLGVGALGAVAAASVIAINWTALVYMTKTGPLEVQDIALGRLLRVFGEALAPSVPGLAIVWAAAALLAVLGFAVTIWAPRSGADRERAIYLAVMALAALAGYFAALKSAGVGLQYWHYLSLIGVLALACDAGVTLLVRRARHGEWMRIAGVAAIALAVASNAAAAVRVRMTNVDRIATLLAEGAQPNDLIVVLPWVCGISFDRYYRGAAPWMTVPDFDEHRFHRHLLVAERMRQGSAAVAPELERIQQTLQAGGRVWVVGQPMVPLPGDELASLPPAPSGPRGWRAGPYLDNWELQVGALLDRRTRQRMPVEVPSDGPINYWENLPLAMVEGWS